jgi:hypothetical protein
MTFDEQSAACDHVPYIHDVLSNHWQCLCGQTSTPVTTVCPSAVCVPCKEKRMNLVEGVLAECTRVRALLPLYDEIPTGIFAATMMRASLERADQAIGSGDVVALLAIYEDLKGYTA